MSTPIAPDSLERLARILQATGDSMPDWLKQPVAESLMTGHTSLPENAYDAFTSKQRHVLYSEDHPYPLLVASVVIRYGGTSDFWVGQESLESLNEYLDDRIKSART